ncbi:MAG: hypothetical protein HY332_13510 [Chloroflexi bacterium]|nr:hypothetical protein [Chloroflexota bacterium]
MQSAIEHAGGGFAARFGAPERRHLRFVLSPYRICPLGAHVDHQDGLVTGMAIDQGVVVAFAARDDTIVRAASANFPGEVQFDVRAIPGPIAGDWGNFIRGAAAALSRNHRLTRGLDLFLLGQLPIGGLSSSAAVGVGALLALEATGELDVTPEENVALARAIENDYVGLHSGVLDQSMILLSRDNHLLQLDCRTGARRYVAFGASSVSSASSASSAPPDPCTAGAALPVAIGVAYSGLSHALVGTGYNQRVAECREAAARLLALAGITPPEAGPRLRDVGPEVFDRHRAQLPAPLARRAAHYFGEQARVVAGTAAWAEGDVTRFGRLVAESGRSSIENYECGAPELIALYEALLATPGVYGARFSGAGFRGSCLALVDPAAFDEAGQRVRDAYLRAFPQYAGTFGFSRCASGPSARLRTARNC